MEVVEKGAMGLMSRTGSEGEKLVFVGGSSLFIFIVRGYAQLMFFLASAFLHFFSGRAGGVTCVGYGLWLMGWRSVTYRWKIMKIFFGMDVA